MISLLDSCVIYPPALRDVLMWLASVGAYEPRWSDEIHAEWMRNVITFNLRHFPRSALAPHGMRPLHPDAFLELLATTNQPRFIRGIQAHRTSLKNPPRSVEEYLEVLRAQGLSKTALLLEAYREVI